MFCYYYGGIFLVRTYFISIVQHLKCIPHWHTCSRIFNWTGTLLFYMPPFHTWTGYLYFWKLFLDTHVGGFFLPIFGECTCANISCYYYFMEFQHGQNPNSPLSPQFCFLEMFQLLFWDFNYIFAYGVLHRLNILHIHQWSQLPQNSHMWSGCMHAHSCHVEGAFHVDPWHLTWLDIGELAFIEDK